MMREKTTLAQDIRGESGVGICICAIVFLFIFVVAAFMFWWPLFAYSLRYWFS